VKQLDNLGAQVVKATVQCLLVEICRLVGDHGCAVVWLDKDMVRGMQWELHASAAASTRDMLAGCLWLPAGGRDPGA
jgi:hypothetical protein